MLVACRACCRAWLKRSLLTGVPAGIGAEPLEGSILIPAKKKIKQSRARFYNNGIHFLIKRMQ